MTTAPDWLRRYRDGERGTVWHELRQLGARVREPEFAGEAQAVCDEVARRSRSNVEVLVAELSAQGYVFHDNDDARTPTEPLTGPAADAQSHVAWLEQRFGPVPMLLSSWIRIVGDVWLVGTHPQWPESAAADPLVVEAAGARYPGHDMRPFVEDEFAQWREDPQGEPFQLPVAPDSLTKADVSGGMPYGIVLPDAGADATIVTTVPMPFVSYLRSVFDAGGFPKWTGNGRQTAITRALAARLAPL